MISKSSTQISGISIVTDTAQSAEQFNNREIVKMSIHGFSKLERVLTTVA